MVVGAKDVQYTNKKPGTLSTSKIKVSKFESEKDKKQTHKESKQPKQVLRQTAPLAFAQQ